jgi:hypothetical protein
MKRNTSSEKKEPKAQVPELRAAMESVNNVIEANRRVRSRVQEISAMTTTIIAPLLNNT